jgi:signal peptidase II
MTHRFLDTLRSPAAVARFVLVAAIGLTLDLWTKWLAFHTLLVSLLHYPDNVFAAASRTYDFIPGWLRFEVTVNQGAVFGIGQGQRVLFLIVSAAAVAFLVYLFVASKPRQWFYQIILGLLLAGVLGNVYDRLVYGYVRDMIHALPNWPNPLRGFFPSWQYIFPWIFNVADSMLCIGVALMLIYTLIAPSRHPAAKTPQADPPEGHAESQRV